MKGHDEKPYFHVTAGLIRSRGKLLITRRPRGSHLEGLWEFPGGKQEKGESLEHCLEREIREELGIKVRAEKALLTVDHEYDSISISLHVYDCTLPQGEPEALEGQEIMWVFPGELEKLTFPPPDREVIQFISRFFSGKREGCQMFYKKNDEGYREIKEGMKLKTLVFGRKTLLVEFRLEKGKEIPAHSHPHEQTGYLVSGRINLFMGDEKFEAGPGDSWCIAGDVEHTAVTLEDSVIVEVFSPVREDYLP